MPHEKFKLYRFGKPLWKTSGRLKPQADIHPHPKHESKKCPTPLPWQNTRWKRN